ncbi:unnamed protein product, partial [marine sediment metagenome]
TDTRMAGRPKMLTWMGNSFIVVVGTALLSVTVTCCAAYVFAFYNFRFKKALWLLLLAGIMVPRIALIIPLFVVVHKIGLTGTLLGIILSRSLAPASLYLARTYFETVPKSLLEVARIDGASETRILRSIVVPISKPIITCLALFSAVRSLSDFVWQGLQLMRGEKKTLLVGMIRATALNVMDYELHLNPLGRKFAMSMILMLPLLVIFFTASRYFVGALGGAIKE